MVLNFYRVKFFLQPPGAKQDFFVDTKTHLQRNSRTDFGDTHNLPPIIFKFFPISHSEK
jgi:hypothetical protein